MTNMPVTHEEIHAKAGEFFSWLDAAGMDYVCVLMHTRVPADSTAEVAEEYSRKCNTPEVCLDLLGLVDKLVLEEGLKALSFVRKEKEPK